MWLADGWNDYEVIDCSKGEKLERWGDYLLVRPDPQVIWDTPKTHRGWKKMNGHYHRSSKGGGEWEFFDLPQQWTINYKELTFNLKPFSFKHTGLFPEQAANWDWFGEKIRRAGRPVKVLNLFAYTGGATLAAAKAGASVTHVDASKGMVTWAKENAHSSDLADASIRWIVDDCVKFVEREIRRGNHYDAIIMDPPSYGRGPKRRNLENRGCDPSSGKAVRTALIRRSPFLPHQLLHHRPCPFRSFLYDGRRNRTEIRRNRQSRRSRTARIPKRTHSPLRSFRTLGEVREMLEKCWRNAGRNISPFRRALARGNTQRY